MQAFEWRPFKRLEPESFQETKRQFHGAIQNVAAIGRKFSPFSQGDEYASMTWVPGLSRLAGQWVKGDVSFRSSISFEEFAIYLVDEKVTTLASFELEGRSHRELMVWLEEQIGKLGLDATNLTMNLPYDLPERVLKSNGRFHLPSHDMARELSHFFHNSYVALRSFKTENNLRGDIKVWPHHFDQALTMMIKDSGDPETDTLINLGMSPGDEHFGNPYFYVSSWPFADVQELGKLSNNAIWYSEDWTGAIFLSKNVVEGNQHQKIESFYREASTDLIGKLTN